MHWPEREREGGMSNTSNIELLKEMKLWSWDELCLIHHAPLIVFVPMNNQLIFSLMPTQSLFSSLCALFCPFFLLPSKQYISILSCNLHCFWKYIQRLLLF